jgi:hypothetical protein
MVGPSCRPDHVELAALGWRLTAENREAVREVGIEASAHLGAGTTGTDRE